MMQLLCNGERLDLYENTGLQLKKDNPLFAFDKLSCERTTQFKLPCTPTNDRVFSLARIPAYSGEGMRRRFAATLVMGTIIKNGYLYVASFDGKDYAAIFVTGELVGLQAIKDLGKLSELVDFGNAYVDLSTSGTAANPNDETTWLAVNYEKEKVADVIHPSIHLRSLYHAIVTAQGIHAESMTALPKTIRIVVGEMKGFPAFGTGASVTAAALAPEGGTVPTSYQIDMTTNGVLFNKATAQVSYLNESTLPNIKSVGYAQQMVALQDLDITFPSTWNDRVFIGCFKDGSDNLELSDFTFYGDRSFDASGAISGASLKGRTVTVKKGQKFVFVEPDDYVNDTTYLFSHGWEFLHNWFPNPRTYSGLTISGKVPSENQAGTRVRLQDNLPDMTFVELLKTIAGLTGRVLNYTDAGGVTFEDLGFDQWNVKYLEDLLEIGEVQRTFADYAQRNIVRYNEGLAMSKAYTIDNDNLESEKDLQVLPFGEGEISGGWLYLKSDFEDNIMSSTAAGTKLRQRTIGKNIGLQALCTASTQIKVKCRMAMLEYDAITAKTLLQVRGTQYVWTSSVWQKDTAEFTLAKIA